VILLACVPLALVAYDAMNDGLGANPVEAVLHRTGDWALRLLLATLAVSPLRRWTGWPWLHHLRRPLGLLAFGYAMLHALTYVVLDRGLVWEDIVADVLERPYVTAGFTALVLMVPLAVTSTRAAMRRLGPRWQQLHRLVYVVAVLAVLHFLWSSKLDRPEPVVYAGVLAVLLLVRLPAVLRGRRLVAQGP
jgi:sulfoxide reductase heme-binding subunit YedZ